MEDTETMEDMATALWTEGEVYIYNLSLCITIPFIIVIHVSLFRVVIMYCSFFQGISNIL